MTELEQEQYELLSEILHAADCDKLPITIILGSSDSLRMQAFCELLEYRCFVDMDRTKPTTSKVIITGVKSIAYSVFASLWAQRRRLQESTR